MAQSLAFNKPQPLNLKVNLLANFKTLKQQANVYFKATLTHKEDEDVQVARLLNLLGNDALKLYNSFNIKDSEAKVDLILKNFEDYFTPVEKGVMEHFRSFTRHQKEGEKFDKFYADLKNLVKACNFGTCEDSALRTQIVQGIKNKDTQTRLLREYMQLKKMVSFCQSVEQAIVRDRSEVPTIKTIIPKIAHHNFYSVLDLKDGYYQVCLDNLVIW